MSGLVFVGAFNPPTFAHTQLAQKAMCSVGAEYVTFVPSKQSYIRDDQEKDHAFSDLYRLLSLQLLAKIRPWMRVSSYEINSASQPRTYQTLVALRDLKISGSLLIGTDKLEELDNKWMYVPEIAKEFGIVCMERSGDNAESIIQRSKLLCELRPFIRIVSTDEQFHHISSTRVRRCLAEIESQKRQLEELVEPELYSMIVHEMLFSGH
ncbi:MAG: hypothetical protein IJ242_17365 [Clostridia bacterium]|nr:hypothetical protein [Clostridia bacterium]